MRLRSTAETRKRGATKTTQEPRRGDEQDETRQETRMDNRGDERKHQECSEKRGDKNG